MGSISRRLAACKPLLRPSATAGRANHVVVDFPISDDADDRRRAELARARAHAFLPGSRSGPWIDWPRRPSHRSSPPQTAHRHDTTNRSEGERGPFPLAAAAASGYSRSPTPTPGVRPLLSSQQQQQPAPHGGEKKAARSQQRWCDAHHGAGGLGGAGPGVGAAGALLRQRKPPASAAGERADRVQITAHDLFPHLTLLEPN